jgi:CDP-diglyceride synthetase
MTEYDLKKEEVEEGKRKKRISIDFGRQGGIFVGYVIIILGFYGIVANTVMTDRFGEWIAFLDMDRTLLIWPYLSVSKNFFLPFLLLFIVSFALTYKEDIPAYGIKASLWLVPIIIAEGFLFYWSMFGISLEPFRLQFLYFEGYINVMLLFLTVIIGSLLGMLIKKLVVRRKEGAY